jgi:peptidyl-prolyl cis-trans isomerase C
MAIVVNGERIEDRDIQEEAQRLRPRYEQAFADEDPGQREAQLLDWSKENVIERVLLRQDAVANGQDVAPPHSEAALDRLREQCGNSEDLYKEFNVRGDDAIKHLIELQIKVQRRIDEVYAAAPEPTESEIRDYYELNKEQFQSGEQIRVAHIVKYVNWQTDEATAKETMTRAYQEIQASTPFEVVVDKYTDCADSGGDLGYVMRGQMVEEFEDVVFHLAAGQVSKVFRTRFGYHIAKVYERRPPVVPSLKDIRKQVGEAIRQHNREQALEQHLDQLRSQARVEEA